MPPKGNQNESQGSGSEDAARLVRNAQEDAARLVRNAQEDAARLAENNDCVETRQIIETQPNESESSLKKDKMHTIGEMASRLTHDLQNPLTIIKNTVEILKIKQPDLDENTKGHYQKIERAVQKMTQQIRDVLDYVRTSNLQVEKISFAKLLKNVLNDLDVPQNIKIIIPTEDIMLLGDAKQLETVFANLILNSVQAIDGDGKIMIQAIDGEHMVAVDVIDNGRGIEKDDLPHVFEPLFTTKQTGTGLGLASCKAIIENHGGSIDCSSIPNRGTVFTVQIPKRHLKHNIV